MANTPQLGVSATSAADVNAIMNAAVPNPPSASNTAPSPSATPPATAATSTPAVPAAAAVAAPPTSAGAAAAEPTPAAAAKQHHSQTQHREHDKNEKQNPPGVKHTAPEVAKDDQTTAHPTKHIKTSEGVKVAVTPEEDAEHRKAVLNVVGVLPEGQRAAITRTLVRAELADQTLQQVQAAREKERADFQAREAALIQQLQRQTELQGNRALQEARQYAELSGTTAKFKEVESMLANVDTQKEVLVNSSFRAGVEAAEMIAKRRIENEYNAERDRQMSAMAQFSRAADQSSLRSTYAPPQIMAAPAPGYPNNNNNNMPPPPPRAPATTTTCAAEAHAASPGSSSSSSSSSRSGSSNDMSGWVHASAMGQVEMSNIIKSKRGADLLAHITGQIPLFGVYVPVEGANNQMTWMTW